MGQIQESDDRIKCKKCGSTNIHIDNTGYSTGNGCCGALLIGPLGLLCGQAGANKIRKTCLNCNHRW